jgi:hypothetical protein
MTQPVPDFAWYSAESSRLGLSTSRCPFQNVNTCPRYFYSLSLLGDHGCTKIEKSEDERLLAFWKNSPLAPRTREQDTQVGSTEKGVCAYHNFCPEIAFDRFRIFATYFSPHMDEIDTGFAHERLGEEGAPADHPDWFWSVYTPQHYAACPLYSQLCHEWPKAIAGSTVSMPDTPVARFDVFISHASEDKDEFVRPLAAALTSLGLKVWYDEWTLTIGDSLRRKIDEGLAKSDYGVVILSNQFFDKDWPQAELDGLFARETAGRKVILPVWHQVTKDVVLNYSPMLAGKMASNTDKGFEAVAREVFSAVRPTTEVSAQANSALKHVLSGNVPSTESLSQLLRAVHAVAPLLYKLDEPVEGNTARVFFSAMQVFFHGTNLLTSDLDRELLYATDNLLRVISAPHLHVEYRAGKCATAARSLGTFCKRRGLDPMLDPSEGAEELIHQFRLLHASLLDLAQALPVAAASDQPLLRLLIALLKYAQFQSPKQPFPLTGGTLHQALRTILARAVTAHLKVKLPDPLDDIELGDIRSYCHATWKEVETEESSP